MKKNVAGQVIGAEMITAADGTAFTGSVTCYYTIDGGSQTLGSVGSGVCTHEGNGLHTYTPAQGETNGNHIAWTFIGTGAIPVTIQVYPAFPQTGDTFTRLGAPAGASIAADLLVIDNFVDELETRLSAARAGYLDNLSAGAVALEATLTAMKGGGWTTETLVAIKAAIDALLPTGVRTVTIQLYETGGSTPIADVVVTIFNSDETLRLGTYTTDSNGQVVANLDDATYKIRSRKAGATFTTPETIVVTADSTKTLYGDTITIAAPADPDVCRVYDYLFLADGVTKPDEATVRAEIVKTPFSADGKIHSGDIITEVYDSDTGLIYWDIVQGATVSFLIKDFIKVTRVVPALATQRLADL